MPFPEFITADEAAAALAEHIKGKTVLITGVSPRSLGAAAAKAIAKHDPKLFIFASRTQANMDKVAKDIQSDTPGVAIRTVLLDLADQRAIRVAADEVLSYPDNIDIVIHNASIMGSDYTITKDGIESQFGIDHIGAFLFLNLIMPRIIAAGPGTRLVIVTSWGHRFSDIRWEDINFSNGKEYERWKGYGQAKTANMLYALALSERLKDKGVVALSLHPGSIPETDLGRYVPPEDLKAMGVPDVEVDNQGKTSVNLLDEEGNPRRSFGMAFKTLAQGGASLVIAAFDPSLTAVNGHYLHEGRMEQDTEPELRAVAYAQDKGAAERLWTLSEKLVGQQFKF